MYPEWTPDGRHLLFEATRDGIFGVWIVGADGAGLRRLRPGITRFPAISPDGTLVACQFERDKRWQLGTFKFSNGELVTTFGDCKIPLPLAGNRMGVRFAGSEGTAAPRN